MLCRIKTIQSKVVVIFGGKYLFRLYFSNHSQEIMNYISH